MHIQSPHPGRPLAQCVVKIYMCNKISIFESYLLLKLLPPALDLQAPCEAGQQLAGDGASVASEHDGGLVGVPMAWLHVHENELDAGRPLWRLSKVQLPVEPAGM